MITTQNLVHAVTTHEGTLDVLKDINLTIQQGESVAIVGASGSGKSTLLGMIAGLDQPSSGRILLDGKDISTMTEAQRAEIRQRYVAFVFQNFQLLNGLSALENVALPLEVKAQKDAHSVALRFLERVGLAERLQHNPQQLSGGEQQRVAVARAFACQAPIIFADEPTGNLDAKTGEHIANLLFDLNKEQGTTLVLVTHSPELAARCDRILTMNAGQLTEQTS